MQQAHHIVIIATLCPVSYGSAQAERDMKQKMRFDAFNEIIRRKYKSIPHVAYDFFRSRIGMNPPFKFLLSVARKVCDLSNGSLTLERPAYRRKENLLFFFDSNWDRIESYVSDISLKAVDNGYIIRIAGNEYFTGNDYLIKNLFGNKRAPKKNVMRETQNLLNVLSSI